MPRVGQNPAKFVSAVSTPAPITVAVLSYIPFLSGYYEESLDLLRISLESILDHTKKPYDLLVFDNGSCLDAVKYLRSLRDQGLIQILILSSRNVGKVGAWNTIFSASPGEFIAYSDSDILFLPGWLEKHLEIFENYPQVGTVSGLPRRRRITYSENTLAFVEKDLSIQLNIGQFIPREWIEDHALSTGKLDEIDQVLELEDYSLQCNGVPAYITAQHFQFMIRKETVRPFIPIAYDRPMGADVAKFDRAIDGAGYLRLATADRVVIHMGNRINERFLKVAGNSETPSPRAGPSQTSTASVFHRLIHWKPVRWLLLGIYNRIFRIYYSS